jgi:glycerophosphoryl diester phosphodiesterase
MIELEGHRGALAVVPGNSLTGFAYTLGVGVSSIEIDVWVTADGQLAVIHDNKLPSADGATVSPHELPLAQLPVLLSGHKAVAEHRAPTLAETLALFRFAGATEVVLDVEIKADPRLGLEYSRLTAAATAQALAPHLAEQALRVRSFDRHVLEAVGETEPRIERVGLIGSQGDNPELRTRGALPASAADAVAEASELGLTGLAPYGDLVDAAWVDAAHGAGLQVLTWGGSEGAERVEQLLAAGVDGLCVDDPAALRRLLAERGYAVPAPRPIELPGLAG